MVDCWANQPAKSCDVNQVEYVSNCSQQLTSLYSLKYRRRGLTVTRAHGLQAIPGFAAL